MKPLALLFSIVALAGCANRETTIPEELVGVWRTSARKYEDRFMEFTPTEVRFGMGETLISAHPVLHVEKNGPETRERYIISYADEEGQPYTLSLYYDLRRETVRLENRPRIAWSRG